MKVGHCIHILFALQHIDYQQEPVTAQQSFSTSHDPAVWRTIPVLKFLQWMWGTMANTPRFDDLIDVIGYGLENMHKWYCKTKDTDTYFICLGQCS